MAETLAELITRWDLEGHKPHKDPHYNDIHKRLSFYEEMHYSQYVPTIGSHHPDFESRLENWIENLADEAEKRTLLELAPRILFFSQSDFAKLHEVAMRGPITRWIIDELGLMFGEPDFDNKLAVEIYSHTWFCPISDSMQISDFHHTNNIGGIDFRPDWRSLEKFGDKGSGITNFMSGRRATDAPKPLKRIVLLEDFVGSGTQMEKAARFAASLPSRVPVLLVPLIICPAGAAMGRDLATTYPHLRFDPVIELTPEDMITDATPADGSLEAAIADLARSSYAAVVGDGAASPRPYSPFGFPRPSNIGTGATVVLYSNTPANTLPIIQHKSNTWNPLFPRSARIR